MKMKLEQMTEMQNGLMSTAFLQRDSFLAQQSRCWYDLKNANTVDRNFNFSFETILHSGPEELRVGYAADKFARTEKRGFETRCGKISSSQMLNLNTPRVTAALR